MNPLSALLPAIVTLLNPVVPVAPPDPPTQAKTENAVYTDPATANQQTLWSVSPGANTVTVSGDEVYLSQREPRNTSRYAIATKGISVGQKGAWRVSFSLRMGELSSTPSAVALYSGNQIIGWVGADNHYRVLGTFFGKDYFDKLDLSVFPLADNRWHTITFASKDGETTTIERDGKTIAKTKSALRPDTIKVGQIHLLFEHNPPNLQQSEIYMRGLRVEKAESP
ncbi:MAG: hypothetical protein H8F28_26430 [Fibrella sp.]|nr:hypothetical protein [Armatimonadota bacterium]